MFARTCERQYLLGATIIPRKYSHSVILERLHILGKFAAMMFLFLAAKFPVTPVLQLCMNPSMQSAECSNNHLEPTY